MKMLSKAVAVARINQLYASGKPFLFITDFLARQNHVLEPSGIKDSGILFEVNGYTNSDNRGSPNSIHLEKTPVTLDTYQAHYDQVVEELSLGNSYLLNLTFPTKIKLNASLKDVFCQSSARYKLCFKEQFVVFSPETFIQIEKGKISSCPMKGTIDAGLPDAKERILSSKKEMAEHATIVDLIRNDMSVFAENVSVEKFRYVDEVQTSHKHLLQVSSKIVGDLFEGYEKKLGNILYSLLPAGSICGAPKNKTLKIISEVETYNRNYYTGVFGYFDGTRLDSGVMIRYIEKEGNELVYKSGGGIHSLSKLKEEYQEMVDKVYVPLR